LRPNRCRCTHGYYWQPIESRHRPIRWYHRQSSTNYRSPTIPHDWLTAVRYYRSRSVIYIIWKPVCDFLLVINSNLGPILHRSATIHPWWTDRWWTTTHANSSTFTKVRLAKNLWNSTFWSVRWWNNHFSRLMKIIHELAFWQSLSPPTPTG